MVLQSYNENWDRSGEHGREVSVKPVLSRQRQKNLEFKVILGNKRPYHKTKNKVWW